MNQRDVRRRLTAAVLVTTGVAAGVVSVTDGPAHAAVAACEVDYQLRSEWPGGFLSRVLVHNRGTRDINGWALTYTYPPDHRLGPVAGAAGTFETPDATGVEVTLTPYSGREILPAGGTASIPSLTGTFTQEYGYPVGFALNGVPCALTPPQPLFTEWPTLGVYQGQSNWTAVALTGPPLTPYEVTVSKLDGGDPDLVFSNGLTRQRMTFTEVNWKTKQEVQVSARRDPDYIDGTATFALDTNHPTVPRVTIRAYEIDPDDPEAPVLVIRAGHRTVREGGRATLRVRLSKPPAWPVEVVTAVTAGDPDLTVAHGGSLVLDAGNWNTDHPVTLATAEDRDARNGRATVTVRADHGIPAVDLTYREIDNDR